MLLKKGLFSDSSLYRSRSTQNGSPRSHLPMGGWQPAVRSPTSSQGSEGASDSLRAMLKLVCST